MTRTARTWLRFLLAVALLAAAAVFLSARNQAENLPPHEELATFPKHTGSWVGRDNKIPPEVLKVLGPGEFLTRVYWRRPDEPYIDFFVAYFPSQRIGDTIHSPQNCLPGAGWTPIEFSRLVFERPGGSPIPVNRYVITKGSDRLLVLYWYQAHGRVVASEYWAKFYLVADAIRLNRTDGALVRVITPVGRGESERSAQSRAVEFAQQTLPALDQYIPR